eukprot:6409111-Amphidinium_carterae.1
MHCVPSQQQPSEQDYETDGLSIGTWKGTCEDVVLVDGLGSSPHDPQWIKWAALNEDVGSQAP